MLFTDLKVFFIRVIKQNRGMQVKKSKILNLLHYNVKLVHGLNKGIKQNIKACGYTYSVVGKSWRQRTIKKSEGVTINGSTNIFLNYRIPLLDLPCPLSSLVICVCVWDTDIHLIQMCLIIILCMGRIADGSPVAMC